jgi:hypothetical protein
MSLTKLDYCQFVFEQEQGKAYDYCYNLTAWAYLGVPLCKEHAPVARALRQEAA